MSNDLKRSARFGGILAATMTYLTLLSPLAPLAPAASQASRLSAVPRAYQSRAVSLHESGNLHLTSRHGFTLNEQGTGTGTISGTIYVHLKIVSTKTVTAEMNIYLKGGSITGEASAAYRREGATGSFAGSLSIVRGSGSYAHAHGSGLSFSGTIRRSNYAVTVHVNGTVSD
jgi:hypothetical protein